MESVHGYAKVLEQVRVLKYSVHQLSGLEGLQFNQVLWLVLEEGGGLV